MKAIILAAGKGVRMRPLTEKTQKVLLPINEKPYLEYMIDNLLKIGINEFIFVVGYKKGQIERFVKNKGINATLVEQEKQLGTGHAVGLCMPYVDDEFFLFMGDDHTSINDLKALINKAKEKPDMNIIGGMEHDEPERFGVFKIDDEKFLGIEEKPEIPPSKIINCAVYKFNSSDIFPEIAKLNPSERGELEITDAITALADQGKMTYIILRDWFTLGKPEDISDAEMRLE